MRADQPGLDLPVSRLRPDCQISQKVPREHFFAFACSAGSVTAGGADEPGVAAVRIQQRGDGARLLPRPASPPAVRQDSELKFYSRRGIVCLMRFED